MKKTKIICTVADNRCDVDFIKSLYENGMNVVRINSAHATIEGAGKIVENVRKVSDRIAILIDTKGPEVRLTRMNDSVGFVAHTGELVEILDERGSHLKIISKIENQQGVDNLDDILTYCYGVMVARGDLGVEIPAERIPLIQKEIVKKCRDRKKPVIIATQMLQSMIDNPRPTRAEVTDIANAIFQSADAIMLSGESAYGKYPAEAVNTMTRIATETEKTIDVNLELDLRKTQKPVAVVLAKSLVAATLELPVKAIIFDTYTGRVGRYLSTFRPKVPIYAMCYNDYTMRELGLVFGVNTYPFSKVRDKEEFAARSIEILSSEGIIRKGDLVGFIGGVFGEQVGATYMELKYI